MKTKKLIIAGLLAMIPILGFSQSGWNGMIFTPILLKLRKNNK